MTPTNPLAPIATPAAVAAWLKDLGLEPYADAFAARGWHGDALLRLPDEDQADALAAVLTDPADQGRLTRALVRLLRAALTPPAPPLTRADLDASAAACQQLAADWQAQPWLATLIDQWPGPIAHEARALGQLLAAGNPAAALWQLRDLAEVLIKLPAVILARDLLTAHPDHPAAGAIHQTLYAKPPAMGDWLALLCHTLAPAARAAGAGLLAADLAGLVLTDRGKPTTFAQALRDQTRLRNQEMHGAWRLDDADGIATLRHWLLGDLPRDQWARAGQAAGAEPPVPLAEGLAFAVGLAPWAGLQLAVTGPDGTPHELTGAASIAHHHDQAHAATEASAPVRLLRADRPALDLAPWLAARVCALCGYRDLFFFNGGDGDGRRFDLLDYQLGHRMSQRWHQAPDLRADYQSRALTAAPGPAGGDLHLGQASTQALFDALSFDARYLSPAWLRKPLRAFIAGQDRGIFWLQAPGHIGKTQFVRGLAGEVKEKPLRDPPPKVAAVFIRKEYRYDPAALFPVLERRLAAVLDLGERNDRRLPQVDLHAADPPAAFAALLAAFRALACEVNGFDGPLLVCLDGLDELRPPTDPNDPSVLDFLPAAADLPPHTWLVLTSRLRQTQTARPTDPPANHTPGDRPSDADDCPDWVFTRTQRLRADPADGPVRAGRTGSGAPGAAREIGNARSAQAWIPLRDRASIRRERRRCEDLRRKARNLLSKWAGFVILSDFYGRNWGAVPKVTRESEAFAECLAGANDRGVR